MSRLDDLGEILEGEDKKGTNAESAQKLWSHRYERISEIETIGQTDITVIKGIKGRFVYQDEENTVKVSYAGHFIPNAPECTVIDDIQVTLYNKQTPESIDALVTLNSPDTYNRKKLQPYVTQLKMIEEETKDEKKELGILATFKEFRPTFISGLQEVIKKIIDGDTNDPITKYTKKLEEYTSDKNIYPTGPNLANLANAYNDKNYDKLKKKLPKKLLGYDLTDPAIKDLVKMFGDDEDSDGKDKKRN